MIIHYKCPNCGSDMAFDSESGKLSCHSCGRKDNIEDFSDKFITTSFSDDEAKEYHCENCGATIITEAETTATTCSFCGAGVVLADRLSGAMAPAKVIPFTISKKEAMEAFKTWCKNGRLTPNGFITADRIKNITGIYVPFWLYDLNSKVQVNALCTKVRTYTRGDYIYTETRYYNVYRDINLDYVKVPIDASEKMDDELMDKLEPYHYDKLKDFKTPYLAGYIAEKYDYDEKNLLPRAKGKIQSYIESYIRSTITGYSSVKYRNKQIDTRKKHAYYTLLPVWMVYYDFDKSEHTFAMNGQTGKVVGKPPISYAKVAKWFGGIAGATFITLKVLSFIIGGELW
ncbi:MAG TPA: TFIIB-type zinc ribbon-containing protein [Tissierellales bacterium]|nr:TFIIB-type zinc ribbon-containing protein [Tissierellales bacterium]